MARVYMDMEACFEFETTLDGAAIPVSLVHLSRLMQEHGHVCGYQLIDVERVHNTLVLIRVQLLIEQEFSPFFVPEAIGDSFHDLAGASHDILLQGTPLSLTRLHRARVLA